MPHSPIDSKRAGQRNEKLILSLLRKHGSLSQSQLCRLVGIGSSTASTIVARLRDKGFVLEQRGVSVRRGPKPVNLTLNPDSSSIIAIEINPSYCLIGLFDFVGQLIRKVRLPLGTDHSPDGVTDLIASSLKSLLKESRLASEQILGVGVTLSGSVSSSGLVHLSSPLGWKDVPLCQMLSRQLDLPVTVYSNRVRLLAEIALDSDLASRNILYLNVANGVGSTVYMNGGLVFGSTGRYGEIGHNVIDPEGPVCGCGHQGCLEAYISGPALACAIARDVQDGVQTLLAKNLNNGSTPETLLSVWPEAVAAQDAYAIGLRHRVAVYLSRSAAEAINSYDPDTVILGGYICQLFAEDFIDAIERQIAGAVYDNEVRQIDIRTAKAGEDALICGVCDAVFRDFLALAW